MTERSRKLAKTGMGTIRKFFGDAGGVVVGIERDDGLGVVALLCDRDLAAYLVQKYGTPGGGSTDMKAIIGLRVEYGESRQGLLVKARLLVN